MDLNGGAHYKCFTHMFETFVWSVISFSASIWGTRKQSSWCLIELVVFSWSGVACACECYTRGHGDDTTTLQANEESS